jgi:UDP-GlcNAc:undecaprenyl-phosphate GlcNAc-1-phosphate transferase
VVSAALALLVAFFVGGALTRLGPRLGFVDLPDDFLKPHTGAAVPLGGVAIFVAVHVSLVAAERFDPGLLAASGMLLVLGLADDRIGLSPRLRLAVEVAAGVVLAMASDLAAFPGGMRSLLIGVVLVVVTVNAVNLLDGLDGLAGSTALVTAAGTAALAASRGLDTTFGMILVAALAGFLVWNWPPARMFLGDNGAYTVGIFLVYGMLAATLPSSETLGLVAFGLIGVFAVDLAVTLLRRALRRRPLFAGDRSHVYDQLRDRGWTVPRIDLTFAASQAAVVVIVIGIDRTLGPWPRVVVLMAVFVAAVATLGMLGFLRPEADAADAGGQTPDALPPEALPPDALPPESGPPEIGPPGT